MSVEDRCPCGPGEPTPKPLLDITPRKTIHAHHAAIAEKVEDELYDYYAPVVRDALAKLPKDYVDIAYRGRRKGVDGNWLPSDNHVGDRLIRQLNDLGYITHFGSGYLRIFTTGDVK